MSILSPDPEPRLRVTVGASVYTSDDQKIGRVKEIRGGAIKVDAPLRRDYWVRTEGIASAIPGDSVVLGVDRAHLSEIKVSQPAAS